VASFADRYELIRRIGAGGMGEVWLGRDQRLAGRPVAIKIMHAHMLPNERDLARFEREMRLAAMMDHPGIVTVYTTGTHEGAPFMVMEYLSGHDLEQVPPPPDAAVIASIGRDVCGALAYAHGKGVIHRDIKPGNLFRCDSGRVKVTDFGIATAVSGTTLSTAGMLVGTFAYLPPERWRGDPPDFSNDVWAAGCVLYRSLSGTLPRVFPAAADYAAAALRGDPVPPLRDLCRAPAWLTSAVMAMLDLDPARRPTAAECVRLLSGGVAGAPGDWGAGGLPAAAGMAGGGAAPPPPGRGRPSAVTSVLTSAVPASRTAPSHPRRPGRRRLAAILGGAAALALAGSLIAWQFHTAPGAPGPAASTAAPPASRSATTAPSTTPPASAAPASRPAASSAPATTGPAVTSPAASSPAASTAASSPAQVTIPNVVGLSFTSARLLLEHDGFVVVGRHTRLGQTVTGTSPSGHAAAGSVIMVFYGTGT